MTCDQVDGALASFIDGELHGDAMREIARHVVRCPRCEAQTVELERLQAAIRGAVAAATEAVDVGAAWSAIASRLGPQPVGWRERLGALFESWPRRPLLRPVMAGGAVAVALTAALVLLLGGGEEEGGTPAPVPQALAQQARIDTLTATGNVRIWNTADAGAVVIWVDDAGVNVEGLDP
jgi:anti-sigma factor RsiW